MSYHYGPGKAQMSLTPYRPTITRSPYTPNHSNTAPRPRNPGSAPPTRTIFGVRIRNPLSPGPLSPTGQQSPFGSTLRFRYPPTAQTPVTPTVQTPYGTALRPRTPSQISLSPSPLSPTSPSPFGPTLRPRTPSSLAQSPNPTQNQGYYPGTLNRNSSGSQLSLHQYPKSPGAPNRNSYGGNPPTPNMHRTSFESNNGYNRYPSSSAATLNRNPYDSNNGYGRHPSSASTLNRTSSYEGNNYNNYSRNGPNPDSVGTLNRYPAQGTNTLNRNPSTSSRFSRKASYDAPLPVFPPENSSINSLHKSSSTPQHQQAKPDPIRRSPSVTSTKRKGPHSNKGSKLLSDLENQGIYSILGKGRQTLSSAVVQLLFPSADDERKWKLREVGILCFVRDATRKSYFLEVISLRMKRVIFSQEIYEEFDYRMPRPRYLTFEGDNSRIGLSFASSEEASDFKEILDQKMDAKRQRRMDRQTKYLVPNSNQPVPPSPAPTVPQPPPPLNRMQQQWNGSAQHQQQQQTYTIDKSAVIPQQFEHSITLPKDTKVKKKGYTFRKSKEAKKKPVKLDKSAIGAPMDFKHVQHAGFDPKRGFVSEGIDDAKYLKILQETGMSGKEAQSLLQDKDTRQYIYNFVEDYEQNVSNPSSPAGKPMTTSSVPPPPSKTTNNRTPLAPPPVPSRQSPEARKNSMPKVIPPPPPFPGASANSNQPPKAPPSQRQEHSVPPTKSITNAPPPSPLPTGGTYLPPPPPPMPSEYPVDIDKPDYEDDDDEESTNSSPANAPPVKADVRSDLMRQIQEAKRDQLKRVDPNATLRKPHGGLSDVLDEIRNGTQLRKADETDRAPTKSPEPLDGLAGALARALAERSKAINPESSASEDEDDFDTEDDWDD